MNARNRAITPAHLWLVWAAALVLRVIYLILAVSYLGIDRLATYAPDSEVYLTVARHILTGDPMGDYAVFRVGPGYGLIIAIIRTIFGPGPVYLIVFNILMGSLAPVFIYLLAHDLIRHRVVALAAGLVCAVSFTSVSLSCAVLTDQPFFTFHAAGLWCFARGFNTGKWRWFIASALIAGAAVFIRSTTQFWPFLLFLIPLVIPVQQKFSSRAAMIGRVGATAGIMLLLVLAWTARNQVKHDTFTFGSNGVLTIRSCLGARAIVDNTDEADIIALRERWEAEDGDRTEAYVEAYHRAKARFLTIFVDHPGWVIRAYIATLWSNIRAGNHYPVGQIPALAPFWRLLIRIQESWLGVLIFFAAAAGVVCLFIDKNYPAAMLLGLTLVYFTLLAGFSFWQGSRIYFPAEMAWSILIVYAGYRVGLALMRIGKRPAGNRV